MADLFNALFEMIGAALVLLSVRQLLKDRLVRGVHLAPVVFFTLWGAWNLFYYPSLDQWLSFAGALLMVLANACWLALLIYFKWREEAC